MDSPRIEDLKRRIQKDPASIAFAQLAEEYRRAGQSREAIDVCRTGLKHHPGYLSARVTLGRALLETGQLEQAEHELTDVLRLAPENLAARRGIAEAFARRGDDAAALTHYEMALALAPRDLELQHAVTSLRERVRPPEPVAAAPVAQPPSAPGLDRQAPGAQPPQPSASAIPRSATALPPQERAAPATSVPPPHKLAEPAPPLPPRSAIASQEAGLLPVFERWLDFIVADRQQRQQPADGTR